MNLRRLIRELQKEVKENIKHVNMGGCGFFTFFVITELEKHNIPYLIRVVDDKVNSHKGTINFEHFWIEVEQDEEILKFDAINFGNLNESDFECHQIYSKEDLKLAIRFGNWNPQYKIEQNKKLRAVIRSSFQSIKILTSLIGLTK